VKQDHPLSDCGPDGRWRKGFHSGGAVLGGLNARFGQLSCEFGPRFFPDLADTTEVVLHIHVLSITPVWRVAPHPDGTDAKDRDISANTTSTRSQRASRCPAWPLVRTHVEG
jgi:hypothetical protein